ncbi:DUF4956 domain-containing protein [Brevibacillus daliensis]|uniref:DUF4956 domain-containing protein n=1 Tax=Brevibacillus daliensis TaxID=2892995 RepID=UPI001E4EE27D|nr:DUF4956 domain-containing protein [Brevibacillus daliensis]
MNRTTFSDIFKSSFLENTINFSIIDSLIAIVTAFVVGLFIYLVYKKTFSGVMYSHTFSISLIVMTMATALIIIGVSSNVLLSLGMVGALSIVRFRTPIKDPMDIVYIFWAIASGILCGAGFIPLVIMGAILIGLVLLFFVNRLTVENPFLLIVKYQDPSIEKALEQAISAKSIKHTVKSKSVTAGNELEVIYEIRVKKNDTAFLNKISGMEGVKTAMMLSYDGNFTA